MDSSIFKEYYTPGTLHDRKVNTGEEGVDVIIPILNTNELWESNLLNYYHRIPINQLLIGDGGSTDESVDIVKRFPRVKINDQSRHKTLGYRIQELMENVTTDWFIYLHADVYLPEGWYDEMIKHQDQYDFFECNRKHTVLFEYIDRAQNRATRPYSGSQMGKIEVFRNIKKVDDDFLYRNEDIIFTGLMAGQGYRYGRVPTTYHHHQTMNRRGEIEPNISGVSVNLEINIERERQTYDMAAKAIMKYLDPTRELQQDVFAALLMLRRLGGLNWRELKRWIREVNPKWSPYTTRSALFRLRLKHLARRFLKVIS